MIVPHSAMFLSLNGIMGLSSLHIRGSIRSVQDKGFYKTLDKEPPYSVRLGRNPNEQQIAALMSAFLPPSQSVHGNGVMK